MELTSETFIWDLDPELFRDGWWTIFVYGDDRDDPDNTINDKNFGGLGLPAIVTVFLQTPLIDGTTTVTSIINMSNGIPIGEAISFTIIGALMGSFIVAVGVLTVLRRRLI